MRSVSTNLVMLQNACVCVCGVCSRQVSCNLSIKRCTTLIEVSCKRGAGDATISLPRNITLYCSAFFRHFCTSAGQRCSAAAERTHPIHMVWLNRYSADATCYNIYNLFTTTSSTRVTALDLCRESALVAGVVNEQQIRIDANMLH